MATATVGRIREFNSEEELIRAYLERFELLVTVNSIAEDKRVSMLLLVIGQNHYLLVWGLVSPTKPEDKTLIDLKAILIKHYDPEPYFRTILFLSTYTKIG